MTGVDMLTSGIDMMTLDSRRADTAVDTIADTSPARQQTLPGRHVDTAVDTSAGTSPAS